MTTNPPSTTYWKAVRPDGTDFHTGKVRWLPRGPLTRPRTVRHPTSTLAVLNDHSTSLAVSTDPTRLPGAKWPMRLCRVEPVPGCPVIDTDEHKRQSVAWRVVEELDPAIRFGPQGVHVAALIERAGTLTMTEARALYAAQDAAWGAAWRAAQDAAWIAARDAAWDAIRNTAWEAAWDAVRDTAWEAGWYAARGLVVRDLISTEHYDILTRWWRTAVGPIHPDDPPLTTDKKETQ